MEKTLKNKDHLFADPEKQIQFFETDKNRRFGDKLKDFSLFPLKRDTVEILQINIGKMCNQVCKHCHVDAGPGRKEIMTRETMQHCLDIIRKQKIKTVDLTGGAPEMNPHFRWLVEELTQLECNIMVRCNLTILVESKKYAYLPEFFKDHKIHVISSLPHFMAKRTDAQRGEGVFDKSIEALKLLNRQGYGNIGSGLQLDLVYNPSGAFLPPNQSGLEKQFKEKLYKEFKVIFNNLLAITNLPVSRFLDYLINVQKYNDYLEELMNAFNPMAVKNLMCKNTLSVSWDGYLYDCDFNQMLDLKIGNGKPFHVSDLKWSLLKGRKIQINQHCFGCTAGAGSSCGGATV